MDIRQRLFKQDPSTAGFIAPRGDVFPTIQFGNVRAPQSVARSSNTYCDNVLFSPEGTYANAIATGSEVQIRVYPGFKKGVIDRASLRMRITNNDAAPIQFCNAYQLIDQITLLANGGNDILWQCTGDGLYENTVLYDPTRWSNRSRLANTTTAWGTGSAIAAGATAEYTIDLIGNILQQVKLFAFAPRDAFIWKIKFRPQSVSQQAGAATACTLSDLALIFNTIVLDDDNFNRMKSMVRSYTGAARYINEQTAWFPSQSFTAGTPITLKLNSINDAICHLTITARANGVVGDNLNAYYDMDDWLFEILDGANVPQLSMALSGKMLRYHEFPERFESELPNNKAVYIISFAEDPLLAYNTGANTGYMPFDGNYQIRITPTATVVRDLFIRAHSYQMFSVDADGKVYASN